MAEAEDRISGLPEEIIHEILARLRSTKQPAQLAVLSKRWTHLWRSFPVLEFQDRDFRHRDFQCPSERSIAAVAALAKKFAPPLRGCNNTVAMESVRITTDFYSLADQLFDLAANNPLREIDFEFWGGKIYRIPRNIFLGLNNNINRRLQVLKLTHCDFSLYGNPIAGLGSSLKVLSLRGVKFPLDWDLNSMIAGASLLEDLTVENSRLRVVDHPSLKVVTCMGEDVRETEIIGAPSLEKLVFLSCALDRVQVSSTPNLKDLRFEREKMFTGEKMSELITRIPSLESFTCYDRSDLGELKLANNDKLRQVKLRSYHDPPKLIEIDSHRLANFYYEGQSNLLPKILCKTCCAREETSRQSCDVVAFHCRLHWGVEFRALKQFLAGLRHVRLTIEFKSVAYREYTRHRDGDEADGLSPAVTVEHMKLTEGLSTLSNGFLGRLFRICHPKILSVPREPSVFELEYMYGLFMKTRCYCGIECKCWRSQVKAAKVIKTMTDRGSNQDRVDISEHVLASMADREQISLALTWH